MTKGITWEWASNLSVREEKKGDWGIEQLKKTSLRRRRELHEGNNAIASCRREKNLSFFYQWIALTRSLSSTVCWQMATEEGGG